MSFMRPYTLVSAVWFALGVACSSSNSSTSTTFDGGGSGVQAQLQANCAAFCDAVTAKTTD